ncbi:MAG TPA: FHA domain-containing protein [Noviherbaspirillum sp.]|jgi:type III secretion protein D|uniref:FHA domain-containing protein n=1 Tax=Noviherbaspirillum sp. TaxID=1926288 RepID=UPI002F92A456
MPELRILSGLHRGATLPLDGMAATEIGSDESADVVLLDHGIEPRHAFIEASGDGWLLKAIDGEVRTSETNTPTPSIELLEGSHARIGRVWITIADARSPWQDPPQDPPELREEIDDTGTAVEGETDLEEVDVDPRQHAASFNREEEAAPSAGRETEARPPDEANAERHGATSRAGSPRPLALLATVIVAAASSAYFLAGQSTDTPLNPEARQAVARAAGGAAGAVPPAGEQVLAPAELRAAFRKRLAEVDLLKRFDLNLKDNEWKMQAALDDEEAARFERTLAAFVAQHRIAFPISAKVGSAEHMLPFRISQVISGANASIVTSDGNRLYVGDEYQGVRLVSIKGTRISFAGKRKIEVKW